MHPTLRNVLAVIAGAIAGSAVNMGTLSAGMAAIPPPTGADMMTPEGIRAALPLLRPEHFATPLLAHALGTFAGAFLAAKLGATHKLALALGVGLLFLCGGIAAAFMIPAPAWFIVLDLLVAYLPMGLLGGKLATGRS